MRIAIKELNEIQSLNTQSKDLVSFVIMTLQSIDQTVENTVSPWEKRGYWKKSDRFRRDWSWTNKYKRNLHHALMQNDWIGIKETVAAIEVYISNIKVSKKHRMGKPWIGSWEKLRSKENLSKYQG